MLGKKTLGAVSVPPEVFNEVGVRVVCKLKLIKLYLWTMLYVQGCCHSVTGNSLYRSQKVPCNCPKSYCIL